MVFQQGTSWPDFWESERSSSVACALQGARRERGARRSMANGEMVGSSSVLRDAPPFNHTPPRSAVCAFGGISPHSLHFIRRLALRARKGRAAARARQHRLRTTEHGGSSASAKSFFVHHTQQLAAAAQVGDAKGIRNAEEDHLDREMKMRLIKDACFVCERVS